MAQPLPGESRAARDGCGPGRPPSSDSPCRLGVPVMAGPAVRARSPGPGREGSRRLELSAGSDQTPDSWHGGETRGEGSAGPGKGSAGSGVEV